jgi:hypothetical protein
MMDKVAQKVKEATSGAIQMVDEGAAQFGQFSPAFPSWKRRMSGRDQTRSAVC